MFNLNSNYGGKRNNFSSELVLEIEETRKIPNSSELSEIKNGAISDWSRLDEKFCFYF